MNEKPGLLAEFGAVMVWVMLASTIAAGPAFGLIGVISWNGCFTDCALAESNKPLAFGLAGAYFLWLGMLAGALYWLMRDYYLKWWYLSALAVGLPIAVTTVALTASL